MQILIDIPDSDILKQQEIITVPIHFIDGTVCEAGGFGFDVLPSHGRLIDADAFVKKYERDKGRRIYVDNFIFDLEMNAPTIIEADK